MGGIEQHEIRVLECQKCHKRFPHFEVGRAYDLLGEISLTGRIANNIVLTTIKDVEESNEEIERRINAAHTLPSDEYKVISFKRPEPRNRDGRRVADREYYDCLYCDGGSVEVDRTSVEEFERSHKLIRY